MIVWGGYIFSRRAGGQSNCTGSSQGPARGLLTFEDWSVEILADAKTNWPQHFTSNNTRKGEAVEELRIIYNAAANPLQFPALDGAEFEALTAAERAQLQALTPAARAFLDFQYSKQQKRGGDDLWTRVERVLKKRRGD